MLLFGSHEAPQSEDVLAVLAKRGEPTTPDEPAEGLVWSSIAGHWSEVGYDDDYISTDFVERLALKAHPWTLAGGGATELKTLLEERAGGTLTNVIREVGRTTVAGEDDAWIALPGTWARKRVQAPVVPLVLGECVRDWSISGTPEILYPYESMGGVPIPSSHPAVRALWPWRALLERRTVFGKEMKGTGRDWWEHLEHYGDRLKTPLSIGFAFVATHNHFVLDRGGKAFNRSAPMIKLPETATEEDHLALLAYLNSSTACFWMKQVFQPKGSTAGNRNHPDPARAAYEFAGTQMQALPVPDLTGRREHLVTAARRLTSLAEERAQLLTAEHFDKRLAVGRELALDDLWSEWERLRDEMLVVQEDIDWIIYSLFGLADGSTSQTAWSEGVRCPRGERPGEHVSPRRSLIRERDRVVPLEEAEVASGQPASDALAPLWELRREAIAGSTELRTLEAIEYKRVWRDTEQNETEVAWRNRVVFELVRDWFLDWVEGQAREYAEPQTTRSMLSEITSHTPAENALAFLANEGDSLVTAGRLLASEAVPYLSALTFTEAGMEKHDAWRRVWELQRREDQGESLDISPPPPYSNGSRGKSKDFRSDVFYSLRGKLDVPKERFISYPGCESDEDGEPVYGWAGWDHTQRAQALVALYQDRKTREGWEADRLTPMLAGLLELLPWLKQWHDEPMPDFDTTFFEAYDAFLENELRELSLTRDDLTAWRPAEKKKGRRRAAARKEKP